jgi:toxin ParE1/3/4
MAFQVLITDRANQDLSEIVAFIKKDNPGAAEKLGHAMIDHLKILRDFPFVGRMVPERGNSRLREIIHFPYRIVYRVNESENLIQVLRFWHAARGKPELQEE